MRYLFFLLMSFVLYSVQAQTTNEEFLQTIKSLGSAGKNKEVIKMVESNKNRFNFNNEADVLLYSMLMGKNYYLSGEYVLSVKYLETCISILDKNEKELLETKDIGLLQLYYDLADVYYRTESDGYEKTLRRLKHLLDMCNMQSVNLYKTTVDSLYGIEFMNLAQSATQNVLDNNHYIAIEQIKQLLATEHLSKNKNDILNIDLLKTLGDQYYYIGDIKKAEECYLEVINNFTKEEMLDLPLYRATLSSLCMLYSHIHNNYKALIFGLQAKELYEKNKEWGLMYAGCLSNCSIAYLQSGNHFLAKSFIDTALIELKRIETPMIKTLKLNEDSWKLKTIIEPYSQFLSNAIIIYMDLGLYEKAMQLAQESLKISNQHDLPNSITYNNLAYCFLANYDLKNAEINYELAYNKENSGNNYIKTLLGYNLFLVKYLNHKKDILGFATEISQMIKQNIDNSFTFFSSEDRESYIKCYKDYFPLINMAFYEIGKERYSDEVYNNIITTKNLLLRSANNIKNSIYSSGDSINILRYDSLSEYSKAIIKEDNEIVRNELKIRMDFLEKNIIKDLSLNNNNDITWKNIRNSLGNKDIAIEFYNLPLVTLNDSTLLDGEPRYCAVIVKHNYRKPKILPLTLESELLDIDPIYYYTSDSIYLNIWKPLEKELKGVKNIYFSPDRELNNIAIEYVMDSEGVRMNDKYNMYRLSTTREIVEKTVRKPITNTVLYGGLNYYADINDITEINQKYLMANNVYRSGERNTSLLRDNFSYLPGTSMEIKAISDEISKYENINTIRFTGLSGTENSFISLSNSNIDILHLATHGFFYSEDEANEKKSMLAKYFKPNQSSEDKALIRSGLIFSGANIAIKGDSIPEQMEDGILTALEISNMNFYNLDLVVLSACETGKGEYNSEGVFGLQRGFKLAGAKSILMSLWKVDDMATNMFMIEFYKNYLAGENKIISLNKAQEFVRSHQEFSDPKYWAGFILLDGLN